MKYLLLLLVSGFAFLFDSVFGQAIDPYKFYPSAVGNKWRMHDHLNLSNFDSEITRDSVLSNGTRYLFFNNSPTSRYFVDTSRQVFQIVAGSPVLWYKLDAQPIDSFSTSIGPTQYLVRVSSFTATAFGQAVPGKVFSWYYGTARLPFAVQKLAYGVGVVSLYADVGPVDQDVTGYRIDGVSYGSLASVELVSHLSPSSFYLLPNFPNPFNPTTSIQFSIPEESHVTLQVFDLLGRLVASILDESKPAGVYRASFSASGLSSGGYVLRLRANEHVRFQKIVVAK